MKTLELAEKAAGVASDKQASDVIVLDTRKVCFFADYFIICTADNIRQIEAIASSIAKTFKDDFSLVLRQEGSGESGWVILDASGIMVHIFGKEERYFYELEKIWERAKTVLRIQ